MNEASRKRVTTPTTMKKRKKIKQKYKTQLDENAKSQSENGGSKWLDDIHGTKIMRRK